MQTDRVTCGAQRKETVQLSLNWTANSRNPRAGDKCMCCSCRKPEFDSITHVEWLTNVCNPSSRGSNTSGFHQAFKWDGGVWDRWGGGGCKCVHTHRKARAQAAGYKSSLGARLGASSKDSSKSTQLPLTGITFSSLLLVNSTTESPRTQMPTLDLDGDKRL